MYLKAFITNLGLYNEGYLVGEWVELPVKEEELEQVYKRIHIDHQYEEIFITDYDTDTPDLYDNLSEYENIEHLNDLVEALERIDSKGDLNHLLAYWDWMGGSLENAIDEYDNTTFFEGWSVEDVAKHYAEACYCYDIPEDIVCCVDWEQWADNKLDYHETDNGILVN